MLIQAQGSVSMVMSQADPILPTKESCSPVQHMPHSFYKRVKEEEDIAAPEYPTHTAFNSFRLKSLAGLLQGLASL